ncbi:cysteine desulfurase family protein [Georgenia sp. 10Sc9-8]|uniref:cysteine desulfurase n=1 Tax=Georgenia halotolerans TaxID=3028317 RepID=A0ABT5U109_9MICO|nr:cysteine desulfurase family protein [Georgenia halotolerans]
MPHYLDHSATTPVRPEVAAVHAEELARVGNPSSLHAAGRRARRRLEEAREELAAALGAEPAEVLFTAGGTEADNLAVKGAAWAQGPGCRVLVSAVEHHAVLDAAAWLGEQGHDVELLPVDGQGVVDLTVLADRLARGPATVVSVMWANNETGVVQPVAEVARLAREAGAVVHSDAVQAVAYLAVDFTDSGLDAMSVTGHKLGGPVGAGALLARRELSLTPVHHGGGQERGVRSGTLDVAGASALAHAVSLAVAERESEAARLRGLRDRLVAGVQATVPGTRLTGDGAPRLPHLAHLTIEGTDADSLLLGLDMAGVHASAGSACQAGVQEASYVLLAMGYSPAEARAALRFSLGRTSTEADVDAVLHALPGVVASSRRANAVPRPGRPAGGRDTAPARSSVVVTAGDS